MSISEQQRAALERRGWMMDTIQTRWLRDPATDEYCNYYPDDNRVAGDAPLVAELLAILGIAPPGYRLVPEEVATVLGPVIADHARATNEFCDATIPEGRDDIRRWREKARAWQILASALSPKEVETR